jgi:hypothetical protein
MAAGLICMLHLGRAGSTVLGDLLNQNPYVSWDAEIYGPMRKLWNGEGDPVQLMLARAAKVQHGLYGFEFKAYHALLVKRTLADMIGAYRDAGVDRFIVLRRENSLRKVASTAVARITGRFHRTGTSAPPAQPDKPTRIRIDPEAHFIDSETRPLVEFLDGFDRFFDELDGLLDQSEVLKLTYEGDIAEDPQVAYRKVCRWLNIAPHPVTMRFAVTTPFPLREVIDNYDEVARALRGTKWEWMLEG